RETDWRWRTSGASLRAAGTVRTRRANRASSRERQPFERPVLPRGGVESAILLLLFVLRILFPVADSMERVDDAGQNIARMRGDPLQVADVKDDGGGVGRA